MIAAAILLTTVFASSIPRISPDSYGPNSTKIIENAALQVKEDARQLQADYDQNVAKNMAEKARLQRQRAERAMQFDIINAEWEQKDKESQASMTYAYYNSPEHQAVLNDVNQQKRQQTQEISAMDADVRQCDSLLKILADKFGQDKAQLARQSKGKMDEAHKLARIAMARDDPARARQLIATVNEQRTRRVSKDTSINVAKVMGTAAVGGALGALAGGHVGDCAVNCSHWHQTPCNDGDVGTLGFIPCLAPCVWADHQSCAGATAAELAHGETVGEIVGGVAGAIGAGSIAYTCFDLQRKFGYTEEEANMIHEMQEGLAQRE